MKQLRVEFHCHTIYSKDSLVPPKKLVEAARRKGLDRLIVTDHNNIGGALEAKRLDPELVIVGEEILTPRGEFLAAFVSQEIPAGLEPLEVLRRLREQGAFISVSHPFARQNGIAATVGSDAHTLRELGRATLTLDSFTDAEGLRAVIRSGVENVRLSSPLIHLSSRFAVAMKKSGWVKRP